MVVIYVIILFLLNESPISIALNTYCSLPCPFMCPAPTPWAHCRSPGMRRPVTNARSSFSENLYGDYEDSQDAAPSPASVARTRPPAPPKPDQPIPPQPEKPAPKAEMNSDPEPPPKKKKSPPDNPSPQSTRRFFASLFSIPGAVIDTMLSGEIVV